MTEESSKMDEEGPLDPRLASLFGLKQSDLLKPSNFHRGLFKYPGSKFDSLPNLMPCLPYRGSFIDVFGGSGCVILSRDQEKLMVYNDLNHAVVDFYRVVREKPEKLMELLYLYLHSREEWEHCCRTWYDTTLSDIERAARWYYMTQYSFIGKQESFGRVTGKSKSKHPILARVAGTLATKLSLFLEIHERLLNVQIENLDFRVCLSDYDQKGAVFYCDPPYYLVDGSSYEDKMTRNDHLALLETIMDMEGYVVLSGYDNTLYNEYEWTKKIAWNRRDRCDAQAISALNSRSEGSETLGRRGTRVETLWIHDPQA